MEKNKRRVKGKVIELLDYYNGSKLDKYQQLANDLGLGTRIIQYYAAGDRKASDSTYKKMIELKSKKYKEIIVQILL